MSDTPKIYAFCNTKPNRQQWYTCLAIAEDGHCLASHVCSAPAWGPIDLGVTSKSKHDKYEAHYPDGYEVVWIDDPANSPELDAAYARRALLISPASDLLIQP